MQGYAQSADRHLAEEPEPTTALCLSFRVSPCVALISGNKGAEGGVGGGD